MFRLKHIYRGEDNWHNKSVINDYSSRAFGCRISDLIAKEDRENDRRNNS